MTAISRRDFLRVCGVALAGAALPPVRAGLGAPRVAFAGRALETAIIRAAPRPDASILRTVHPDRVLSLAEAVAGWFAARDPDGGLTGAAARGFVAARQVQPMAPYTPPAVVTAADGPFWAEVIAPVTVARRWPLPDAPSLGRVGYGGVFRVVDTQADDWDCVWYRNADAAGGGWVQALHARPLDPDALASIDAGVAGKRVVIDAARCALTAWAGDRAVFAAPVAVPASPAGAARRLPAGGVCDDKRAAQRVDGYVGAPWVIAAGGLALHGAYWHNDFGAPRADEGGAVTFAPAVGQWLYRWVEVGRTHIEVVGQGAVR